MNIFYKITKLLLMVFFPIATMAGNEDGHNIKIVIKGVKPGVNCVLGFYYGNQKLVKDSAKTAADGSITFKGSDKYPGGVYLLIPDGKNYFELIMDENQHFTLETDTTDFINNMKVKGSEENSLFYTYQKFSVVKGKQVMPLQELLKKTKDKDSIKNITDQILKIDSEVKAYQKDFIKKNPQTFVSKLFKIQQDPEIPDAPLLPNGKKDSLFQFRYYKAHFFDNVDFNDERLIRSPVFYPKVKQYMEKLTMQTPDSLNVSADFLVEQSRNSPDMFKWMLYWLTYTYESSKIMGMDAVFVHMVEKYYATNQAYWIDSAQLEKIVHRAYELKPILIGKKAPPITMIDSTGKTINLYDVKGKYTVVVFWDEDCGHCKKEIPKLRDLYNNKLKARGVQVYAIAAEDKVKEWKKFIIENKLDWINVHQPDDYKRAVTKKIYDVISTPYIYLLDENKIIKAKHIDSDQVGELIDLLEKEKNQPKK